MYAVFERCLLLCDFAPVFPRLAWRRRTESAYRGAVADLRVVSRITDQEEMEKCSLWLCLAYRLLIVYEIIMGYERANLREKRKHDCQYQKCRKVSWNNRENSL